MAAIYWDYRNTLRAGSATSLNYSAQAAQANTFGTSCSFNQANAFQTQLGNPLINYAPPRHVFVEIPESWGDPIIAEYVKLVNDDTRTGWKIIAIIDGKIRIVDPDADIRSMKDFVLLLKNRASDADRKLIDEFFARHPC